MKFYRVRRRFSVFSRGILLVPRSSAGETIVDDSGHHSHHGRLIDADTMPLRLKTSIPQFKPMDLLCAMRYPLL